MNRQKLSQPVLGAMLITRLLVGCGTPAATPIAPTATPTTEPPTATPTPVPPTATPTPIPPTATPTAEPPTATPTQAITLATSADEIAGTWQKTRGTGYIRFYEEGTFHQARALDDLDSHPFAICEFWFEGTQMFIGQCSVSGVPPCGDVIAIYEVRLLEGDKIQIVAIEDSCSPRRGDTATMYDAVP